MKPHQHIFVKLLPFAFVVCNGVATSCRKICPFDKQKPWSYDYNLPNGPPHWGKIYPNCNGKNQTPINIDTSKVIKAGNLKPLQLFNYNIPITQGKIENTGATVNVYPEDGVERSMILNDVSFNLTFFDFHWSDDVNKRSADHTVDGKNYAMELHLIHKNAKGEIAQVVVFYQESSFDNLALDPITELLQEIPFKKDKTNLRKNIYLSDLVGNSCSFYSYMGSQSVPPCSEGMIWNICKKEKNIGSRQMEAFRNIFSVEKTSRNDIAACRISQNVRPIQPLNNRIIIASQ